MSLYVEDWLIYSTSIKTYEVSTFCGHDEVVLALRVPLCTFNVLVNAFLKLSHDICCIISYIEDVDATIIACCEQNLLVFQVPADSLYFVVVHIGISSLA